MIPHCTYILHIDRAIAHNRCCRDNIASEIQMSMNGRTTTGPMTSTPGYAPATRISLYWQRLSLRTMLCIRNTTKDVLLEIPTMHGCIHT